MAKPQFNWTCPYCDHAVTVTEANYRIGSVELWLREGVSSGGTYPMHVEIIDCPNNACGKSTLTFCINTTAYKCIPSGPISLPQSRGGSLRQKWTLLPQSDATIYPDYVPEAVRGLHGSLPNPGLQPKGVGNISKALSTRNDPRFSWSC